MRCLAGVCGPLFSGFLVLLNIDRQVDDFLRVVKTHTGDGNKVEEPAAVAELSGFCPFRRLFSNLPVLKTVDMTALRTIPCALQRICIPFMNHLNNQMAVQTHRRLTVDFFILDYLSHDHTTSLGFLKEPLAITLP